VSKDAAQQSGEGALEVTLERAKGGLVVRVGGELDLASGDKLERELIKAEKKAPELLVIDMRELSFIDSSGLRLLLVAAQRARDEKRRLVVVQGSPEVNRILEITGADQQLELVSEPPEGF
jgi:anti-anti-sigma factor